MSALASFKLDDLKLEPACTLGLLVKRASLSSLRRDSASEEVRALLRDVLARLTGIAPYALQLGTTPRGKPFMAGLSFNLSHAQSHSLIALSHGGFVGCDIEDRFHTDDAETIAPLVLHASELKWLQSLEEPARANAFKHIWVRKEAALKAMGVGFHADPKHLLVGVAGAVLEYSITLGRTLFVHDGPTIAGCTLAVACNTPACRWGWLDR